MFFFPPSSMEAHNLKLLFNPFAVSGEGDFKMLLLNLNVVGMFIIEIKPTKRHSIWVSSVMQGNLSIKFIRLIISTFFIVGIAYKDLVCALVHGPPACVWDELIIPYKHSWQQ